MLLNKLSDSLVSESVKPFSPGESRKICGFLGLCGEMPIIMRLLDKAERKKANEKWTCQLNEDVDVLLLAIPDTRGYFPWEEECNHKIKDNFPANLGMGQPLSTSSIITPGNESLPCEPGAFVIGVRYLYHLFSNPGVREGKINSASWLLLEEILLYLEFDLPDDFQWDELEYGDLRLYEWDAFCFLSLPSLATKWMREHLDNYEEDLLAKNFNIGIDNSYTYSSEDDFISDIDFSLICNMLSKVYSNSVSGEELEIMLTTIKQLNEKADEDLPPIYQHIPCYQALMA